MTNFFRIKIGLAVAGLAILIWGMRIDDAMIRWVGIGCLAASILLRFLPKRLRQSDYPTTPPPPET